MSKTPTHARFQTEPLLHAAELSKETLSKLITHAEGNGWKLVNWERYGRPAIDKVLATVEGPVKQGGAFVDGLLATQGARARIRDIFPKGIPFPETLRIEFDVTPGQG